MILYVSFGFHFSLLWLIKCKKFIQSILKLPLISIDDWILVFWWLFIECFQEIYINHLFKDIKSFNSLSLWIFCENQKRLIKIKATKNINTRCFVLFCCNYYKIIQQIYLQVFLQECKIN